jgi:SAM-dependent methyltransferase
LTLNAPLSRSHFELAECNICGLIFQTPLPTALDFKTMYEDMGQFGSQEYRDPQRVQNILKYYDSAYQQMLLRIGRRDAIRILEVGAGLAWVCRAAKHATPSVFTVAQDVSAECSAECTWCDVYIVGSIESNEIDSHRPYDIISLTHVIEHLPDPVSTLRRLRQLLSAHGCVFITCPHRPERWAEEPTAATWQHWSYNHVPGHLQYFSRSAMETAARRAALRVDSWVLHENGQAVEAILRP